ncbi:hypothetical protein KC878_00160 [Candidatus Saccharibacteria bacterium]|nr:hypothetical protein [Candidatus Saccharibacteria bacterium]MCB9821426.1 hypothetical protein [Candidatus Nomurabacteria bacterium]
MEVYISMTPAVMDEGVLAKLFEKLPGMLANSTHVSPGEQVSIALLEWQLPDPEHTPLCVRFDFGKELRDQRWALSTLPMMEGLVASCLEQTGVAIDDVPEFMVFIMAGSSESAGVYRRRSCSVIALGGLKTFPESLATT